MDLKTLFRVFDTFHLVLLMIYFWHYAVTHFGSVTSLTQVTWYVLPESPYSLYAHLLVFQEPSGKVESFD